jgi:hypothetical protein
LASGIGGRRLGQRGLKMGGTKAWPALGARLQLSPARSNMVDSGGCELGTTTTRRRSSSVVAARMATASVRRLAGAGCSDRRCTRSGWRRRGRGSSRRRSDREAASDSGDQ